MVTIGSQNRRQNRIISRMVNLELRKKLIGEREHFEARVLVDAVDVKKIGERKKNKNNLFKKNLIWTLNCGN